MLKKKKSVLIDGVLYSVCRLLFLPADRLVERRLACIFVACVWCCFNCPYTQTFLLLFLFAFLVVGAPTCVCLCVCVCACEQDDRYWARRRKNNVAAKRSRDARRLKENQIAIRAGFLEKENTALKMEVADLRKELGRCKNTLAKYDARHGPL